MKYELNLDRDMRRIWRLALREKSHDKDFHGFQLCLNSEFAGAIGEFITRPPDDKSQLIYRIKFETEEEKVRFMMTYL